MQELIRIPEETALRWLLGGLSGGDGWESYNQTKYETERI